MNLCTVRVTWRTRSTSETALLFNPLKFAEFHNQSPLLIFKVATIRTHDILLAFCSWLSLRYLPQSPCWLEKYGSRARKTAILLHFLSLGTFCATKYHNETFTLCCHRALETVHPAWKFGRFEEALENLTRLLPEPLLQHFSKLLPASACAVL